MWSTIRMLIKLICTFFFATFLINEAYSSQTTAQSYDSKALLLLFTGLGFGTVLSAVGITPAAVRNLVHLTMSKPCFIGDVVSVYPGSDHVRRVSGFIESFTFTHVVIRSFEHKQCWFAHMDFEKLTISNWTRRPGRAVVCFVCAAFTSDPDDVETLASFMKHWIDTAEFTDQKYYKGRSLYKLENGYHLRAIFKTIPHVSSSTIKQKLLFAIARAAMRLGITLVSPSERALMHAAVGPVGAQAAQPTRADTPKATLAELKADLPAPKSHQVIDDKMVDSGYTGD